MSIKTPLLTGLLAASMAAGAAWAQASAGHDAHHSVVAQAPAPAQADAAMSEGEVRKIDKDAKKITLKHGELKNLGMPPMTMVFRVSDTAMLDKVKVGDKVRFRADKVDGAFTVTTLEPAK